MRHTEHQLNQLSSTIKGIERGLNRLSSSKIYHKDRGDQVMSMVMLRRLVQEWSTLAVMAGKLTKLHNLELSKVRWATIADLELAARSVMKSQIIYTQENALLVQGVQRDMSITNVTMTDYFEIARQYFLKERFAEAKEWFQHALTGDLDTDNNPSRETLLHYLAVATCFTGDETNSRTILRTIFRERPHSKPPQELIDYYNIMSVHGCVYPDKEIQRLLDSRYDRIGMDVSAAYFYRNNSQVETHSRLCRGEARTDSRLVCRYVHYHQPHLRLQPFKLEELQLDPPVVRFYDLVSDSEAETLIGEAKTQMHTAAVGVGKYARRLEYRTSHVSWLPQGSAEWLSHRIAEATRLDTNFAQRHQLSRYSMTGEYMPHRDHMIYGLSVYPVKNSALLWFNFKPNGDPENGSDHSGCPVLRGSKWVLNKWIMNGGQDVNFPCTLDKEGSFKEFYL